MQAPIYARANLAQHKLSGTLMETISTFIFHKIAFIYVN